MKNRDVLVMTIASFVASVALLMLQLYQFSIRLFFAFIALGAATYFIGQLLLRALSRHREFAADRTASLMTGRPSALASALVKVSSQMALIPTEDLRGRASSRRSSSSPPTRTRSSAASSPRIRRSRTGSAR